MHSFASSIFWASLAAAAPTTESVENVPQPALRPAVVAEAEAEEETTAADARPAADATTVDAAPQTTDAPAPGAPLAPRQAGAIVRAAEAARAAADAWEALAKEIATPAAVDTAAADHWAYALGFRAEVISGNARAYTLGLDTGANGRWGQWGTELKLGYGFGRTRLAAVPVANNGVVSARGERDYTKLLSSYAQLGALFDRVASIDHQEYGELGLGLTWIDQKVGTLVLHHLRTSLGFRTTFEARKNFYFPDGPQPSPARHWIYAPTVGFSYRYSINRHVYVTEEALVALDVQSLHNVRATSDTGLNVQLHEAIVLSLLAKVRYIGEPAQGRQQTDTTFASQLTWNF